MLEFPWRERRKPETVDFNISISAKLRRTSSRCPRSRILAKMAPDRLRPPREELGRVLSVSHADPGSKQLSVRTTVTGFWPLHARNAQVVRLTVLFCWASLSPNTISTNYLNRESLTQIHLVPEMTEKCKSQSQTIFSISCRFVSCDGIFAFLVTLESWDTQRAKMAKCEWNVNLLNGLSWHPICRMTGACVCVCVWMVVHAQITRLMFLTTRKPGVSTELRLWWYLSDTIHNLFGFILFIFFNTYQVKSLAQNVWW